MAEAREEVLRLTNIEPDGRDITVLFECDGMTSGRVLKPGESMTLRKGDRFISYKPMPRHLGITIDTLRMGVKGGNIG